MKAETTVSNEETSNTKPQQAWVPVTAEKTTTEMEKEETKEEIPPVDATKSTGFESITKLPAGVTTPQGETIPSEKKTEPVTEDKIVPTTTDYEITTIRFSYVPTEVTTEIETESTTANWHPVFPTRTKITTIKDEPITTYRPQYMTTTDMVEEITMIPETTPQIEVSSQIVENETDKITETTDIIEETTTEQPTTLPTTTKEIPVETTMSTLQEDTTTMVIEVVTEINAEKAIPVTPSTELSSSTEITETPTSETRGSSSEENSDSNEVITQETTKITSPPSSTTKLETTTELKEETTPPITEIIKEITTQENANILTTIAKEDTQENVETTTEDAKPTSDMEDLTNYGGDVTTEVSSRVLPEEAGSGAAVAIAVSTIGVIALILLVGLLVSVANYQ